MQNVAWPMTIVVSDRFVPVKVKNELSAIPVMIPGSAIGSTSRNDTASRPKKRRRCTAKEASDPSRMAIAVASSAARTDSHSDWRIEESLKAEENHFVESPEIGQLWTLDGLKA